MVGEVAGKGHLLALRVCSCAAGADGWAGALSDGGSSKDHRVSSSNTLPSPQHQKLCGCFPKFNTLGFLANVKLRKPASRAVRKKAQKKSDPPEQGHQAFTSLVCPRALTPPHSSSPEQHASSGSVSPPATARCPLHVDLPAGHKVRRP